MPVEIPERLVELIRTGQCVLFLGAGATRDAGGPTGPELASLLAAKFSITDIPTTDLQHFSDILMGVDTVDREDVDRVVVETLKSIKPSRGHRKIPSFRWKAIFTTNYDRLVEISYDASEAQAGAPALQDLKVVVDVRQNCSLSDPSRVPLYKLHGCISSIERRTPLVLTTRDYRSTRKNRRKMLRSLRVLAREHSVVFVGYSFSDSIIMNLLDDLEEESPYSSRRRMYLVTPEPRDSEVQFFQSRKLSVIPSTASDFFGKLDEYFGEEAQKELLVRKIPSLFDARGQPIALPPKLRIALSGQVDILPLGAPPQTNARPFLSGLPATAGDLANRNDIERQQEEELRNLVVGALDADQYLRPVVVVLGAGGSGKSTLALRTAYQLAQENAAIAFRLKASEFLRNRDIVALCSGINCPSIIVADGVEINARFKLLRNLRADLSAARCRTLLLISCHKAVWNVYNGQYPQRDVKIFELKDRLSNLEARALVDKLGRYKLLTSHDATDLTDKASYVLERCGGHLVVAMLELVRNENFRTIILSEYQNLSSRAKIAYKFVALLHQFSLSTPDYLLNRLSTNDWQVFTDEVIRLESELIIVQDMNYPAGRLSFRSRHPIVAETIVSAVLPKHEDRVSMYRRIIGALGSTEEDRSFLLNILTSRQVIEDLREPKYIREMFELALDQFPDDRVLILHLGKTMNRMGDLDRAHEILSWGRSLDPRDSHILHQLGMCEEKKARKEAPGVVREARYEEARKLYLQIELIEPHSHYGYSAQARLQIERAKEIESEEERSELLSSCCSVISRGLSLVRDDDKGVLEEINARLWQALGQPEAVVELTERLRAESRIRYAATYHLLAAALLQLNRAADAETAIEDGLAQFPGDYRLMDLLLRVLEDRFHLREARVRFERAFEIKTVASELAIRTQFLKAVASYYDSQFERARRAFSELRRSLRYAASTRIRIYLADESHNPMLRSGTRRPTSGSRELVVDTESGYKIPLDNVSVWEAQGRPTGFTFVVGFTLAGPRARLKGPENKQDQGASENSSGHLSSAKLKAVDERHSGHE